MASNFEAAEKRGRDLLERRLRSLGVRPMDKIPLKKLVGSRQELVNGKVSVIQWRSAGQLNIIALRRDADALCILFVWGKLVENWKSMQQSFKDKLQESRDDLSRLKVEIPISDLVGVSLEDGRYRFPRFIPFASFPITLAIRKAMDRLP